MTENLENQNLEQRQREYDIDRAIRWHSLSAYDTEYDKISFKFLSRLEEIEKELATFPKREVPNKEEFDKLWRRTARRNSDKEQEIKRQEMLELVEISVGVELSNDARLKLHKLINDILDFEDQKRQERKEWDKNR